MCIRDRYRTIVTTRPKLFALGISGVVGLIAGLSAQGDWEIVQLWLHGGDFGTVDPQFGLDVGFYVFRLPFLQFAAGWIFAALLVILTAVQQVYVRHGTKEQRPLGAVTLEEIERLQAEGHFPPGSMGPKIEAVIRFLKAGGRRALITNPESLPQAIEGRAGTHFVGGI